MNYSLEGPSEKCSNETLRVCSCVLGKNIVLIGIRENEGVDEFIPPPSYGFKCEKTKCG